MQLYNKVNTRLLVFRLRQIGKFFREIPVPYLIVLLIIAGVVLYVLHSFLENLIGALVCGGALIGIVWFIHLRRKDFHFIHMTDEQAWRVFFTDYLLFSIPFLLLLLFRGYWFIVLGVVAGYGGISFIRQPFRQTAKGFPVPAFIPYQAFELRILFRRYGGLLTILYFSAFVGLLLPYASFASLWFCSVFISEGFKDCESRSILNGYEMPAIRFLHHKIARNLRLYCAAIFPVCLIYMVIRPDDWWLALGFFVLASFNMILFVVSKYALYEPDKKIISGQISLGFSLMGILVPFLAPFTLFLLMRYYIMARKNIIPYLYAYNREPKGLL